MDRIDYYNLSLAQLNDIKRELCEVIQDKIRDLTEKELKDRRAIYTEVVKNKEYMKRLVVHENCQAGKCNGCAMNLFLTYPERYPPAEYEISLKIQKKPLTKLLYSRAHKKS